MKNRFDRELMSQKQWWRPTTYRVAGLIIAVIFSGAAIKITNSLHFPKTEPIATQEIRPIVAESVVVEPVVASVPAKPDKIELNTQETPKFQTEEEAHPKTFIDAIYYLNVDVVKAFLAAGADPNEKVHQGFFIGATPLMVVFSSVDDSKIEESTEIVKALLAAGADVNAKSMPTFFTPEEADDCVSAMVDDMERKNSESTALMASAWRGYTQITEILIAAGADVNAKNISENTALMFAAWARNNYVMRILLAAGADVNAKNRLGYTALTFAAALSRFSWCSAYIELTDTDTEEVLLNAGAKLYFENRETKAVLKGQGTVALLLAAANLYRKDIIEDLVAAGLDLNSTDNYGKTALMNAEEHRKTVSEIRDEGHRKTVNEKQFLKEAGAKE